VRWPGAMAWRDGLARWPGQHRRDGLVNIGAMAWRTSDPTAWCDGLARWPGAMAWRTSDPTAWTPDQ
jgi:hypothetical protein